MPPLRTPWFAVILCLVPLVARGQVPTPDPAAVPSVAPVPAPPAFVMPEANQAEHQLDIATVQIRLMERISASIEQVVDMLNQKFTLEGNYYKDTGYRMRLQLKLVGVGDAGSTMLQVCDGKVRWDFQKVLGMQVCEKLELAPILKKLEDPVIDDTFRIMVTANMGFGGPEAMLAGLRKAVKFDQISSETLDGVEVFVLGGTWRDRSNLLGPSDRPLAPTAELPPYIPKNVRVFVGKIDGWPYKIEMIGRAPLMMDDTREIDQATGRPIGQPKKPPKVDPTKITLRYKLRPVSEITPGLFSFEAPADIAATSVRDQTKDFLAGLDQYIQITSNNKKLEAAKAEGEPLLKAPPIEVPTAPAGGGLGTAPAPTPTPGAASPR